MNKLRKAGQKWKAYYKQYQDPFKKLQMRQQFRSSLFSYKGFKYLFIFTFASNILIVFFVRENTMLRSISRMTGKFTSLRLPKFMLVPMIKVYCKMYGVNLEEIETQDLKEFDTFQHFFIRRLKHGSREIDEPENPHSLCSPCDGTVYNLGDCKEDTLVVVKNVEYKLDEFLLGKKESEIQYFEKVLQKVRERGNELKFILLYLSPSDYHRYHSAAISSTNYRRHIAGHLYPVMPSFVDKKPETFKVNERVNLFGEWVHGFFSTCFIGATNVGSI